MLNAISNSARAGAQLKKRDYRPDIDGLRAIAVLSVVVFHAFPSLIHGGFVGVDIFFVISGFLISKHIWEELGAGTFSIKTFYARRVRRIFPALSVVLLACLIMGWVILTPGEYEQLGNHVVAGAAFVSNIIFWKEAGYFDNAADTKPLLHLWSLSIEEQFYIVWPLFFSLFLALFQTSWLGISRRSWNFFILQYDGCAPRRSGRFLFTRDSILGAGAWCRAVICFGTQISHKSLLYLMAWTLFDTGRSLYHTKELFFSRSMGVAAYHRRSLHDLCW
jgi:hypothetical protein